MSSFSRQFNKYVLIAEVQERPALWNTSHIDFKRRQITVQLWKEVGDVCSISGEAKVKWKSLKDQYRRELHKGAANRSGWQYFDNMQFVNLPVAPSNEEKVRSDIDHEVELSEDDESSENYIFAEELPQLSATSSPPPLAQLKKAKRVLSFDEEEFFQLERKRIAVLEESVLQSENSDLQFFKSLLPYMNRFSLVEKLQVRLKMQEIVLEQYRAVVDENRFGEVSCKQEPIEFSNGKHANK